MSNRFRYATLGAALLAGTAAAHAQTVIVQDPAYVAPVYAAPTYAAPTYVVPGYVSPGYAVPAPGYAPAPVIAQPAPMTREIVTQPQTIVSQPSERVEETVIRREASQPSTIHRSTRSTRVHLTSAQRREVLHSIRYERTATPIPRQPVTRAATYSVGSVLPQAVPTYAMPRQVVYEAPALRGYAYAPVGNRVLLVEPASNMVVDELY